MPGKEYKSKDSTTSDNSGNGSKNKSPWWKTIGLGIFYALITGAFISAAYYLTCKMRGVEPSIPAFLAKLVGLAKAPPVQVPSARITEAVTVIPKVIEADIPNIVSAPANPPMETVGAVPAKGFDEIVEASKKRLGAMTEVATIFLEKLSERRGPEEF